LKGDFVRRTLDHKNIPPAGGGGYRKHFEWEGGRSDQGVRNGKGIRGDMEAKAGYDLEWR